MSEKIMGIIVPFRDRYHHLGIFVKEMKARFPSALILVIEQMPGKPFNRAKLLNVGYKHFNAFFDYFAAHDVDMIPQKADYSFPAVPVQLATKVEQFGYKMPFPEYFGGVTLFNKKDFEKLGGYSNEFWGWGGEDNEMYNRCAWARLKVAYREGMFLSLPHARKIDGKLHKRNCDLLANGRAVKGDGLDYCNYRVIQQSEQPDYIKLTVEI